MAITLLQKNSFLFDEQAIINKFDINNKLGIQCVLECVDKKLSFSSQIQHHVLFLKGRTGSGKSSCMPSSLFVHYDKNKELFPKVIINVVEPRVILAKSISQDNCDNVPYLKFGINTGYNTGAGKTNISGESKLVYMTTDLFRLKLNNKVSLGNIVIIDECHDLDRPMITTLYEIKKYLMDQSIPIIKKPLFIFASATINIDLMVNYFFGENGIDKKIKPIDIYHDGLMINHILGLRNFPVKENYITKEEEQKYYKSENEFVKYILTEGIKISLQSKETWKGLPARDILIFSYGVAFNKLFDAIRIQGGNIDNELDDIDNELNNIDNELDDIDNELNNIDNELDNIHENNELNENIELNENNKYYYNNQKKKNTNNNQKKKNTNNVSYNNICEYPVYVSHIDYDDSNEVKKWREKNKGKTRVLILPYSSTCKGFASYLLLNSYDTDPDSQQYEIKIYISTNVLETGKTVNTWYQVYDTGLKSSKIVNPLLYDPEKRDNLVRHPITKSASIQRCGRVGRKCPGISTRVFIKETWDSMAEDSSPENINIPSMAQVNLECREKNEKFNNPVKNNNYIQPNSFDTNLITGRDLVYAGYCTPWGEYINDVREYQEPTKPWILRAEEQYYCQNKDLFETLVVCRNSRKNIPDIISCSKFKKSDIPDNIEDLDRSNIEAIYQARQEYVKYLTGNSKVFKKISK